MKSLDRPSAGLSIIACALAVCAWASPALAAEEFGNHLYDRFQVIASTGSILLLGTDARIDAEDGSTGTEVDVEDDLGFDNTKFQPRAEPVQRPAPDRLGPDGEERRRGMSHLPPGRLGLRGRRWRRKSSRYPLLPPGAAGSAEAAEAAKVAEAAEGFEPLAAKSILYSPPPTRPECSSKR